MKIAPHPRISAADLHALMEQALRDLRRARRFGDSARAAQCERRMNAMIDQFAKRIRTGTWPTVR